MVEISRTGLFFNFHPKIIYIYNLTKMSNVDKTKMKPGFSMKWFIRLVLGLIGVLEHFGGNQPGRFVFQFSS